MKAAVILSLVSFALGSVLEKRECSGNNCNRQVTGTREGLLPLTSRKADCSSFLQATVTPSPTTVTITVTAAPARLRRDGQIANRQVTELPTAIPAYASSCDDAAEYSSACSCWGITAVTSTAPRPTVTVTTTVDYCEDVGMEGLKGWERPFVFISRPAAKGEGGKREATVKSEELLDGARTISSSFPWVIMIIMRQPP
ncbi:hypothetical protein ColKHC_13405 [Colletotrichum higginsianum]|nr:hypothetical protein ColKHC_13405 [Colletotrichum higginsianum]